MPTVFEKLNLGACDEILVVNAPASFEPALDSLHGVTVLRDVEQGSVVRFALTFATTQSELDRVAGILAGKAEGDALLWFAYPKKTSKRLACDFNRDSGWDVLRGLGFDSVRIVAVDADWSALRFRRVEYIRTTKR